MRYRARGSGPGCPPPAARVPTTPGRYGATLPRSFTLSVLVLRILREYRPRLVADLLCGPGPVRVGGDSEDVHVAAAYLHDEQAVQALQGHRAVDVEEVGGKCRRCLGVQEIPPRGVGVPFRCRGIFRALRTRRMVDALARWPSLSSSPWIRWYPQVLFSVASHRIGPSWMSRKFQDRQESRFRRGHCPGVTGFCRSWGASAPGVKHVPRARGLEGSQAGTIAFISLVADNAVTRR
jgi:hypothetical protein